jgi:hypothetical protein
MQQHKYDKEGILTSKNKNFLLPTKEGRTSRLIKKETSILSGCPR